MISFLSLTKTVEQFDSGMNKFSYSKRKDTHFF